MLCPVGEFYLNMEVRKSMNNKKITITALLVTAALMFSYIESLFPFFFRHTRNEAGAGKSGGGNGTVFIWI